MTKSAVEAVRKPHTKKNPTIDGLPPLCKLAGIIRDQLGPVCGIPQRDLIRRAQEIAAQTFPNTTRHASLYRRLYDVVNVVRVIEEMTATARPRTQGLEAAHEVDKVKLKAQQLAAKRSLLAQYRWLIERNRGVIRPANAVQLPTIILAVPQGSWGTVERSFDDRYLVLRSNTHPQFIAASDIIGRLCQRSRRAAAPRAKAPQVKDGTEEARASTDQPA
jgi:hypothetical protein